MKIPEQFASIITTEKAIEDYRLYCEECAAEAAEAAEINSSKTV